MNRTEQNRTEQNRAEQKDGQIDKMTDQTDGLTIRVNFGKADMKLFFSSEPVNEFPESREVSGAEGQTKTRA